MTPDQQKNYEEAAKAYWNSDQSLKDWIAAGKPDSKFYQNVLSFLAGATHAEKDNSWFKEWIKIIDAITPPGPMCRGCADNNGICEMDNLPCEPTDRAIEVHERSKKDAHNSAIDAAIKLFNTRGSFGTPFVVELEKLKL